MTSLQEFLKIPWLGIRPDVILHAGPVDNNGERTWVLEDPVRGNNYRLGYAEGELLFRLIKESSLDAAVVSLYTTTTLRPAPEEILSFISMLQRESLAILPSDSVVQQEALKDGISPPSIHEKFIEAFTFLRIPLIRPDRFLIKTMSWVTWLWSPFCRLFYLVCGLVGLVRTLQEIDLYLGTVSYLFTPQGAAAFVLCLAALKTGHEFAHAYTAKSMGLHVRSIGILFIVLWPLLYTDTTDVWKVPDRRRRKWVSAAGILFELSVGGLALLLWSMLPDGIFKSLMFFLSSTSLVSSVLINLNPFNRYDGYYLLMDFWGIDNLRPRAVALLRHSLRRKLLDWKGPIPEIHPGRRKLIFYGFLVVIYRLFISFSIAMAVYYLYYPIVGVTLFILELLLFIFYPLWIEIASIYRDRRFIGSKFRVLVTICAMVTICGLLITPMPRFERLPCMFLFKGTTRVDAPASGRLMMGMPVLNRMVSTGDMMTRLSDDALLYESQKVSFDLSVVKAKTENLGSGGQQGAYKNWLMAEEDRLKASSEKYAQSLAQMEIRAPMSGKIVDINDDLYDGAYVKKGTYLFTIANPDAHEIKAFIHERLIGKMESFEELHAKVHFSEPEAPTLKATFKEKSLFPIRNLPNESLFNSAGGPIMAVHDNSGKRPRDAYFTYTFDVNTVSGIFPHGKPAWIWIKSEWQSVMERVISSVWKNIMERGFF